MKPHELIDKLVREAGGAFAVARDMRAPTFQGTLHKFCAGKVPSPAHKTAERIAKHFRIKVEAIYTEAAATEEAARLWGAGALESPQKAASDVAWPLAPFITPERWDALGPAIQAIAAAAAARAALEAADLIGASGKRNGAA